MSRWISLIVLLAIIIITAGLLYRVMAGFLLPLFLAAVLAVIFRPVHSWVLERTKNRDYLAAGITTSSILLVVLVPFCGVLALAVYEGLNAVSGDVVEKTGAQLSQFRSRVGLDIPFAQFRDEAGNQTYGLSDLSQQIRSLPDALPEKSDVTSEDRQEFAFVRDALTALHDQLEQVRSAIEKGTADADSVDVQRVQRLIDLNPDAPFQDVEEMIDTLNQTLTYWTSNSVDDGTVDEETGTTSDDETQVNMVRLRTQYQKLKATYDTFHIDLLGGTFWGGLTELANPDARQIETLRGAVERQLRGSLPSVAGQATAIVGSFALGLAIMTISIFYFLKDGPAMIRTIMRLSPLDDRYELQLITEFDSVSRAVVLATLLSAFVQGLLAGVGYFFAGFDSIVLLTLLTMLFALVPFVGAAAIWVPASLWLAFVEQRLLAASVLFIYGATIVSMADNIVKPYVLHGQSKLHPLLALLSVLGGVQALGPIGILVGPMVVSFLQALLNILNQELSDLSPTTEPPQIEQETEEKSESEGEVGC